MQCSSLQRLISKPKMLLFIENPMKKEQSQNHVLFIKQNRTLPVVWIAQPSFTFFYLRPFLILSL